MNEQKCVVVVDNMLPVGIVANAAACLGFSLGTQLPQALGPIQTDASGVKHGGLISIPIPILTASADQVKAITDAAYSTDGLVTYDMSEAAQSSKTQDEYKAKVADINKEDMRYWAVAIYGGKKQVNKLCGSLPLYR